MRQLGVNYNRIRYRGVTAIEVAKRLGVEALGGEGTGTWRITKIVC